MNYENKPEREAITITLNPEDFMGTVDPEGPYEVDDACLHDVVMQGLGVKTNSDFQKVCEGTDPLGASTKIGIIRDVSLELMESAYFVLPLEGIRYTAFSYGVGWVGDHSGRREFMVVKGDHDGEVSWLGVPTHQFESYRHVPIEQHIKEAVSLESPRQIVDFLSQEYQAVHESSI